MQKNIMRKDAFTILCYVCAAGAFSAFFRWLQNQSAIDPETKTLSPSMFNVLVPLAIIGACIIFYSLFKKLKLKIGAFPADDYSIYNGKSIFYPISYYIIGGITVLGGLITFVAAADDFYCSLYRAIAFFAILFGASFPLVCSCSRRRYAPTIMCVLTTLPILMYCLWLVASYKINSSEPTIFAFAVEILALCLAIVAFYYLAGFAYGKASPDQAVFVSLVAAFMCITTLADSRYFGLQLIIAGTAGVLLMSVCMIILNVKAPEELEQDAPEETPEPVEEEEPEEEIKTELVIKSGKAEVSPEPTIQAPDYKTKTDDAVDEILKEYKKSSLE